MKNTKPCSLVVMGDNKQLFGTAAQLAHISRMGGWDAFLQHVAREVIDSFADSYNKQMCALNTNLASKPCANTTREGAYVH